jgi:hypothetical protein
VSAEDWYRNTIWTPEVRVAFLARLARSRSTHNRAQYLRIQAGYLSASSDPVMAEAGLELLDRFLTEYGGETSELALAHSHRAECLITLDRPDEALDALRAALQVQRDLPKYLSAVHHKFADLVLSRRRTELYDEALGILDEFERIDLFPSGRFQTAAARAQIAAHQGRGADAAKFARLALEAAGHTHSGFRYHPDVGLVDQSDRALLAKMEELAAAK